MIVVKLLLKAKKKLTDPSIFYFRKTIQIEFRLNTARHFIDKEKGTKMLKNQFLFFLIIFTLSGTALSQNNNLLQCTSQGTTSYSPPLKLQEFAVTVSWTTNYSCALGNVDSGTASASIVDNRSCLSLFDSDSGQQTINWTDGSYSTYSWTENDITIQTIAGQRIGTINATIIDGRYQGSNVLETFINPTLDLVQCLGSGISDSFSTGTFTVTRL
ncbi:hypothetical protein [Microbulbifer litoralis]|uniref:hypothetical protein n=1 Tax=Microbulbifer litoralis TaxID=2933965 RepID=UPI002027FEBA|nr:hypothetical protein [Microbulbifer sp. GX H0434]